MITRFWIQQVVPSFSSFLVLMCTAPQRAIICALHFITFFLFFHYLMPTNANNKTGPHPQR